MDTPVVPSIHDRTAARLTRNLVGWRVFYDKETSVSRFDKAKQLGVPERCVSCGAVLGPIIEGVDNPKLVGGLYPCGEQWSSGPGWFGQCKMIEWDLAIHTDDFEV